MNSATSSKPLRLVTALAFVVIASTFASVTAQTQSLGTNVKDPASQQRPRTTEPRTIAKTDSGMPVKLLHRRMLPAQPIRQGWRRWGRGRSGEHLHQLLHHLSPRS